MKPRTLAVVVLVLAAAGARLLPHPPNVTPIAAMALFGGASFDDARMALAVPLAAMLLSDVVLGLHATMPFVYLGFLLIAGIGLWLRTRRSIPTIAAGAVVGSIAFFLITNFGVWATTTFYPKTAAGLWAAYVAGLPFFRNTVLGDLFYCAVLFGGWAALERIVPSLRTGAAVAQGS
ncbi:MAG TPA: DUF6580 family putative transport protein [bacterium]|jgi:hypothetical protein